MSTIQFILFNPFMPDGVCWSLHLNHQNHKFIYYNTKWRKTFGAQLPCVIDRRTDGSYAGMHQGYLKEMHIVHYENTPIQIYWKFYHQKLKIFW